MKKQLTKSEKLEKLLNESLVNATCCYWCVFGLKSNGYGEKYGWWSQSQATGNYKEFLGRNYDEAIEHIKKLSSI